MAVSTKNFIEPMLNYFQEIVADTYERKQKSALPNLSLDEKRALLNKGIWYSYDYYNALEKFSEATRLKWLVDSGASFHGWAPVKFFDPILSNDPAFVTGRCIAEFVVKSGITPSNALDSIHQSVSILGCESTRDIACYKMLRDALREEKFNHLFASDSPYPLQIKAGIQNPISCLFDSVTLSSSETIQSGDFCYFSNVYWYNQKYPVGDAQGFNVVCYDSVAKTYLGQGLDPKGVNAEGIERVLWESCNTAPIKEGFLKPEIWDCIFSRWLLKDMQKSKELVQSLKDKTVTWEEYQSTPSHSAKKGHQMQSQLVLAVDRLNLERIERLVNTPLEHIRDVFADFWYEYKLRFVS